MCAPEACRKIVLLPSRSHCQASHEVVRASDRPAIQSRLPESTRLSSSLHKHTRDLIEHARTANHLETRPQKGSTIAESLLHQPRGSTSRTHRVPKANHFPTLVFSTLKTEKGLGASTESSTLKATSNQIGLIDRPLEERLRRHPFSTVYVSSTGECDAYNDVDATTN